MHTLFFRCLPLWVLLVWGAAAKDVPGQFIVVLDTAAPATSKSASRSAVRSAQARVRAALESRQVEILDSVETVLNALIVKTENPSVLSTTPGIAKVFPVRLYKKVLDRAALVHKVPAAGDTVGGWENAGAGMKVAIIDSGIDIAHPAFRDDGFKLPDGFPRVNKDTDNRYTNNKVIVARNYDTRISAVATDRDGHGTAVAMIAAGQRTTGPAATIMGIAPKAYLGNYKVFPDDQDGAPNAYILKAIDDAVADGMDVINLSLGGFPAERLQSDPIVAAVENATRAGVLVVIASGNDGPGLNTVGSPATAPSAISVGSSWNDRVFAASAWFDGLDPFVALLADGAPNGATVRGAVADVASLDSTGLACAELPAGSLTGKIALIFRGTCFFEEKLNFAERAGAIAAIVYTDAARPEPLNMDIGSARLPAAMIAYADGVAAKQRLAGSDTVTAVVDFQTKPVFVNSVRLANFTSKGPGIDNLIKPDLVAIGTSVYTAQPVVSGTVRYGVLDGTSFSAPMVTGAAALLKAYRPGLSADQYKSLLANTAAGFPGAVQQTGVGLLDVIAAVRSTIAAYPSSLSFGTGGGTVGSSQRIVLKNIGSKADTYSISAVPGSGNVVPEMTPNIVELQPGASAEVTIRLSAANLSAQAYDGRLVISGTQSDAVARVPYWHAVTNSTVASIDVVDVASSARRSSTTEFLVRSLDSSGVPVATEPKVKVISSGTGTRVTSIQSEDDRYPGFYLVRVRLSSETGENIFQIDSGSVERQVTIEAN